MLALLCDEMKARLEMAKDHATDIVDVALVMKRMLRWYDKGTAEHQMLCSSLRDVEDFFCYPNIELDFLDMNDED